MNRKDTLFWWKNYLKFTIIGLLIAFVVIAIPFGGIWALNTLFALGIGYSFWNWLAMFALIVIFAPSRINKDV